MKRKPVETKDNDNTKKHHKVEESLLHRLWCHPDINQNLINCFSGAEYGAVFDVNKSSSKDFPGQIESLTCISLHDLPCQPYSKLKQLTIQKPSSTVKITSDLFPSIEDVTISNAQECKVLNIETQLSKLDLSYSCVDSNFNHGSLSMDKQDKQFQTLKLSNSPSTVMAFLINCLPRDSLKSISLIHCLYPGFRDFVENLTNVERVEIFGGQCRELHLHSRVLKSLNVRHISQVILDTAKNLEELTMIFSKVLVSDSQFPALEKMFSEFRDSQDYMEFFSQINSDSFPEIRSLILQSASHCPIVSPSLLSSLPLLEELGIYDRHSVHVENMPSLKRLICGHVGHNAIVSIRNCYQLEEIDTRIDSCGKLLDQDFPWNQFRSISMNLEENGFHSMKNMVEKCILLLQKMPNVEYVTLSSNIHQQKLVNIAMPKILNTLQQLPKLRSLTLRNLTLDQKCIISNLNSLEHLSILHCDFKSMMISSLPSLCTLVVSAFFILYSRDQILLRVENNQLLHNFSLDHYIGLKFGRLNCKLTNLPNLVHFNLVQNFLEFSLEQK